MRFGMGLTGLRDGRDLDVEMTNTVRTQYNMFSHALAFFAYDLLKSANVGCFSRFHMGANART